MHIPNWPEDGKFMRRGIIGAYKDEMPPEVLDMFMSKAGPTLKRLGYDTEENV